MPRSPSHAYPMFAASSAARRRHALWGLALVVAGGGLLARPLGAQPTTPSPPVTPTRTPTSLARHVEPARLRVGVDSFAVMVQGVRRGSEQLAVAREGSAWILSDAVDLPPMGRQESRIRFDAALAERTLRQEGQMRGAAMRIALDFADGAVRGTALTPTRPQGPLDIARALPPGTVDDNAVLPLLTAVRWRPDLDIAFPVLLSGKGTVITQRLRVLGPDSTTVPAGHFDTWRAELTGGDAPVVLHVEQAAPFRLLRVQAAGTPFDVQRIR